MSEIDKKQETARQDSAERRDEAQFDPDFGSAFDDYGDYAEPTPAVPTSRPARKRHLKRFPIPFAVKIAVYLAAAVLLGLLAAKWAWRFADDVLALTRPDEVVEIVINESDDLDVITDKLKEAGSIEYGWLFKLYCKVTGSEHYFDPGVYIINKTYDYHAIVNNLMASAATRETTTLMIPEGASSEEIFELMEKNGVCSKEKLEKTAAEYEFDYDFLKDLPYGQPNRLEGYLFPDTYEFYLMDDPEKVLGRFLRNFDNRVDDDLRELIADSGYSMHEIVTMASIVEGEAANDSERAKIASVMYNRLDHWDVPYLGMDSTVYYGARQMGVPFSTELDSPYNTYLYPGIPAGPICSPGMNSIRAVLYPEDTKFYYFATGIDGLNHFFTNESDFNNFINSDQFKPINPG